MAKKPVRIGGIIHKRGLAKISMLSIPDRPGVSGAIFSALGARGIATPFIVHTIDLKKVDNIVVCVDQEQLANALDALASAQEELGEMEVVHEKGVHIVSIFGPHFGERSGIAGVMFSALASAGINILAISTSISSLSCVLDADDADEAVRVLKEAFETP